MTALRLWMLTGVVLFALLGSLAVSAMRLGWHMNGHTSVLPQDMSQPRVPPGRDAPRDTDGILLLAPFGQTAMVAAPVPAQADSALSVALRGVLVDPDPAKSRAFILSQGRTDAFRVGDTLQSAELVAINADTITLKSGDALVIVGFDGLVDSTDSPRQSADAPAENATDPFARLAAAIVPGQGSIDLRDAPPAETTDEYIDLWRDRITQNPQAAMDVVGVELVEDGYRIKADPNIGVTLAGLRPGDVVTRLNGQAVGDLEKDRALYDQVAAAGIARLEVVREGQALLLTFPLR